MIEIRDFGEKMIFEFVKMHGAGNDFILIDEREQQYFAEGKEDRASFTQDACNRHFGIGADGAIFILKPSALFQSKADFRMRIFNSDGSEAEMCGNGIRCFAKYLSLRGEGKNPIKVETLAGIIEPLIEGDNVKVKMGKPEFSSKKIPVNVKTDKCIEEIFEIEGLGKRKITCIGMGNPHAVIFVENVDKVDLEKEGRLIENSTKYFPSKINVHFVQILSKEEMRIATWERGVGATLACGTGACACAAAGFFLKKTIGKVKIEVPGGILGVELETKGNEIVQALLSGEAEEVFEGLIHY